MEKLLTSHSAITSKYRTVIPRQIRQEMGLEINQEIIWQTVELGKKRVMIVSPKPKRWSEHMRGLGQEAWAGVDTDAYLQALRDEWEK